MTKIRLVYSTAILTASIFSTAAYGQAPGAASGSPAATARPVTAAGAAPSAGTPANPKPGSAAAAPGPAAAGAGHAAPVVTNPPGTPPPAKGASSSGTAGGAAAAGTAAPMPPTPPAMPTPNKEMETFMKGFEGNWRCETKFAPGSMGPGSPEVTAKSTVRIKKEFGGFSWHGEYTLPKSKSMPAMSGVFQIAHEPSSNGATIVGYDSMGSSFHGTGTLSGDSVMFMEEGYMMGGKTKVRETMSKKGPREVLHTYEVDMGRGFQPMGQDDCKR